MFTLASFAQLSPSAAQAASGRQPKSSWLVLNAQPMRAGLLARATVTTLAGVYWPAAWRPTVLPAMLRFDQRGRAVDQQPAQIAVAALADRVPPYLAPVPS